MAFSPIGSLVPYGGPVLRSEILANSITVTIMDSVKFASGFVALGTAGASVLGHVNGISDKGVGVSSTGAAGAALGSFTNTFTTASNNQTVGLIRAEIDISQDTIYSAEVSATIGTTTGSNLAGYRMDLTDEDTLNEGSAATTTAQYATLGVDPANTAQSACYIFESQIFNT